MKYLKLISLLFVAMLGSLFVSCEETAEVDEYANWQERNEAFIDSIARVAETNADGRWVRILANDLNSTDITGKPVEHDTEDYIYCYIKIEGEGSEHPLTTALVNYRGRLIPTSSKPEGKIFDESYKGEPNPATNKPVEFALKDVVNGWETALTHMVKGDIWRVYIPANLGYRAQKKTDIPAYSTLIFDLHLVDF